MRIFVLDGKDMKTRERAYRVIERTLCFPDYFGHNLDALADCLSELPRETAIVFVNTRILSVRLGNYAVKILSCFRKAAGEGDLVLIEKE